MGKKSSLNGSKHGGKYHRRCTASNAICWCAFLVSDVIPHREDWLALFYLHVGIIAECLPKCFFAVVFNLEVHLEIWGQVELETDILEPEDVE